MRAVVVYCHPNEESYCASLRDAAIRGLQSARHHVDVIDLAHDNFNPVMSLDEWENYHDTTSSRPEEIRRYTELVTNAEILVFVYATWWSGVPAQLKGWMERVLLPGVAFELSDKAFVRGRLIQVRHIRVVTTFGSPRWYVKFVNDNGRRLFRRTLRLNTHVRTRYRQNSLYALDKRTEDDRKAFVSRVEKAFGKI